ncbi:MAG: signal peptide peptidase SppA [Actinobacteria bacterium]|nr:signal peptide peptidase SppA [Actinomycetota bacterium]
MKKLLARIIPIRGMIVSGDTSPAGPIPLLPFMGGGATFSDDIVKYLKSVVSEKRVKAIIFEIDSPGGTPYASKEIADAIKDISKPTVAQIREHGTSGAYWIASACKKIIADPLSSIGGIGTRADRLDLSELARKIGIKIDTFTRGEYKGVGSPYSEMSEKEKQFIEDHVESFNRYFVNEIQENRNIRDEKLLEDITSGKTFLGKQALELGLIDYLGGNQKALEIAGEMSGVKLIADYRKGSAEKPGFMARMLRKML